jgi:hypothetical protein
MFLTASVDKNGKNFKNPKTDHMIEFSTQQPYDHLTSQKATLLVRVNSKHQQHITTSGSIDNQGGKEQNHVQDVNNFQEENDIDIINEGYLLVDKSKEGGSKNSRKLTQFVDQFSSNLSKISSQIENTGINFNVLKASLETRTTKSNLKLELPQIFPKETVQYQQGEIFKQNINMHIPGLQFKQEKNGTIKGRDIDRSNDDYRSILKMACPEEQSWECLMFQEGFMPMRNNLNVSRRSSSKSLYNYHSFHYVSCLSVQAIMFLHRTLLLLLAISSVDLMSSY